MGAEQREAFLAALQNEHAEYNFDSIIASISKVDASEAECRNKEDQEAILRELDQRVGIHECNKMVRGKLREAVCREGKGALDAMAKEERATPALINNMGVLLKNMGELEAARPLYEEALAGSRATLGDTHPSTLTSIYNMGRLLKKMGDLAGAVPLFRKEVDAMRDQHGPEHDETLYSARNLHGVMLELGDVSGAAGLVAEFGGL